jgi:hypothetical protein
MVAALRLGAGGHRRSGRSGCLDPNPAFRSSSAAPGESLSDTGRLLLATADVYLAHDHSSAGNSLHMQSKRVPSR